MYTIIRKYIRSTLPAELMMQHNRQVVEETRLTIQGTDFADILQMQSLQYSHPLENYVSFEMQKGDSP